MTQPIVGAATGANDHQVQGRCRSVVLGEIPGLVFDRPPQGRFTGRLNPERRRMHRHAGHDRCGAAQRYRASGYWHDPVASSVTLQEAARLFGAAVGILERLGDRDELLNETLFSSLAHARAVLTEWRLDYNTIRPHSSLGNLPPAHYAELCASVSQRDGSLRALGSYASRPVAAPSQTNSNDQPTLLIPG